MAMNDISFLATTEQDALLAFKDGNLAKSDKDSGAEFLSQLHNAHNSIEPEKKGNAKAQTDTENSIAVPKHKQPQENEAQNEEQSIELGEEDTDTVFVSGDSMLAQISSAQTMSTSVSKPTDTLSNTELKNPSQFSANTGAKVLSEDVKAALLVAKEGDQSSSIQNTISANTDPKTAQSTDSKNDNENSLLLNENKHLKSSVAQAIEGQFLDNKKPEDSVGPIINKPELTTMAAEKQIAQDKAVAQSDKNIASPSLVTNSVSVSQSQMPVDSTKATTSESAVNQSTKLASENGQSTALTNFLTKEIGSTTADKVIASLTPGQRLQLNTQAQAITNSDTANVSNTSSLKEMLAQFITDNEQTQNTTVKQSVSSEINTLNTSEKQTLLTQLNAYIKTEQPQGEQLKALKQTVSELEASIEIKLVDSAKIKPSTFVAGETPNTVNTVAQASSKSVNKADAEISKITVSNDDDLAKQLEQLSKEGLKSTTAEQSSPRVAQIFTQLTAAFNTVQANSIGLYEGLNFEQGLVDTQLLQSQQLQSAAQVKQVSIDPGVMQAINIVKSDAAKLLQERVSSMLSINNKEAEIRLDPPEMGSMQIRIRSDAEQAQINFVVQNQQAKEALEQSMPRLREMLAQQGLELGESTISYGQSGGENPEQSDSGSQAGLANNESVNGENDEQANSASQSSRQQSSSSIDYYA
ncbi:flagellar hook-length control protein FliK [Pseudoalteromonas carrageenovora]|uniref:flagellar hook-length control protein FliK n=1 Tax=Pseudoalteromonas carrageenovora TaxID=227 RepID=UPI0026E3E318|nr:flagellar hook-length control protein FliK [Pseudoalteromonas carrageenovora]MDO6547957.1 flagellar hook-length control protein FliK [Pseudoalteromonas carrageenovora]MDO6832264.1 flagellar hook-length control protein FliK [Pseudoalteromonas carrageenovora]